MFIFFIKTSNVFWNASLCKYTNMIIFLYREWRNNICIVLRTNSFFSVQLYEQKYSPTVQLNTQYNLGHSFTPCCPLIITWNIIRSFLLTQHKRSYLLLHPYLKIVSHLMLQVLASFNELSLEYRTNQFVFLIYPLRREAPYRKILTTHYIFKEI